MHRSFLAFVVSGLVLSSPAWSQTFNVDIDLPGDPIEVGGGVPQPTFGAAAGQPGVWNSWNGGSLSLFNTSGVPTSVVMSASGPLGGGAGFNQTTNTGDFARLMNDYRQIGTNPFQTLTATFTFTGLLDGPYTVYSYATTGFTTNSLVTVPGSTSPNPQSVVGPAMNNTFALGITHAVHQVNVTGGLLTVQVTTPANSNFLVGGIAGFQIVPAPPVTALLAVGIGFAFRRRR